MAFTPTPGVPCSHQPLQSYHFTFVSSVPGLDAEDAERPNTYVGVGLHGL